MDNKKSDKKNEGGWIRIAERMAQGEHRIVITDGKPIVLAVMKEIWN